MRLIPLLRQLLIGTSISRYFPATGTAGLARNCVRGNRRAPCPPPSIKLRTETGMDARFAQGDWYSRCYPADGARERLYFATRSANTIACSVQSFIATP